MNKYFIRKEVIAKDIKQAMKNEKNSSIVEIYKDQSYVHTVDKKIGFNKKQL